MKKYILFLLLSLIIAFYANAQLSVSYSVGYGNFKMNDMKELLGDMANEIKNQLQGLPIAIVDNFPGYITHSLDLSYRVKRHEIGFRGNYLSTGGKIAYSDYTGEYSGKILLNGNSLGINYRYYFPITDFEKNGSLYLFTEMSSGVSFSKLKSKEYIKVFGQRQDADENLDLKGNGVYLHPQLGAKWFITKQIGIQVSGGYFFQLGSNLKYKGEDTKIKSDWSGIRLNGGVSYSF